MDELRIEEIFELAKQIDEPIKAVSLEQDLTFKLTLKIAHACDKLEDFQDAIFHHKYQAIKLSQVEAEFLKAGGLPEGLKNGLHLFK